MGETPTGVRWHIVIFANPVSLNYPHGTLPNIQINYLTGDKFLKENLTNSLDGAVSAVSPHRENLYGRIRTYITELSVPPPLVIGFSPEPTKLVSKYYNRVREYPMVMGFWRDTHINSYKALGVDLSVNNKIICCKCLWSERSGTGGRI